MQQYESYIYIMKEKQNNNTPLGVSVVHTHIHEHITHKAVTVSRAVIEDLAHHGVVEVVS